MSSEILKYNLKMLIVFTLFRAKLEDAEAPEVADAEAKAEEGEGEGEEILGC